MQTLTQHAFRTLLPPAPITKRVLAMFCDFILLFFLCTFVIGKIWIPLYYTDTFLQFQSIVETYTSQLLQGQFQEFLQQFKEQKTILEMFHSIDRILFFVTWGYYSINSVIFQGGTLGKQIFNLHVLKINDLKPLSFIDGILRAGILTFFLFTAFPFLIAFSFFFLCINKFHRGFHDYCCQTYVVNGTLLEQIKGQIGEAVRSATETEEMKKEDEGKSEKEK